MTKQGLSFKSINGAARLGGGYYDRQRRSA